MRAIVKVSDAVDKPCELSVAAGDVTATIVVSITIIVFS